MMLLYHGTSASVAREALTKGLLPRALTGLPSHWEENKAPSRPDLVYLTVAYAGYFANAADENSEGWGIVEVDTNKLHPILFMPDEDYLEQGTRNTEFPEDDPFWAELAACKTMEERTAWFRDNLEAFSQAWMDSLESLGNCAYQGEIPPEAITRVTVYDPKSNPTMTLAALDPSICLANFHFCGAKYKEITRWLAGHDANAQTMMQTMLPSGIEIHNAPDGIRQYLEILRKQAEDFTATLAERDGFTILGDDNGR